MYDNWNNSSVRANYRIKVKWFDWLKKYKINSKDISLAIMHAINRNLQLKQRDGLEKEMESLIDERYDLLENIKGVLNLNPIIWSNLK